MADYNSAYTGTQIDENLGKAATAVQPAALATVATSGAYTDLTGRPTLATVATSGAATDLGSGAATDGYVLTADGAGGAAWEAASGGGGTPGGTDTQVQFNDGGAFGGDSGFTFDKTNNTLGLGGGTITANDPIIDMAQTWNNGAVAFTALKANVTDTASAAGSLLMDLQVGGVSKVSVRKDGRISGDGANPYVSLSQVGGTEIGWGSSTRVFIGNTTISLISNNSAMAGINASSQFFLANSYLGFGTSAASDLILTRDAANTLAQRNGVNAQAFNLYQSYTDASNYTRGRVAAASGIVTLAGESAGTGAADIDIAITPKGTGRVRYGTHAAIAAETVTGYIEIKDAGGTVRKIAVVS